MAFKKTIHFRSYMIASVFVLDCKFCLVNQNEFGTWYLLTHTCDKTNSLSLRKSHRGVVTLPTATDLNG